MTSFQTVLANSISFNNKRNNSFVNIVMFSLSLLKSLRDGVKLASKYPLDSRLKVFVDYISLWRTKGLNPTDYYNFDFLNQGKDFRTSFLGINEQRLYLDYLNPVKYYSLSRNKFLAHKIMEGTGIRKTTLYCYFTPEGKVADSDTIANDLDGVYSILKEKNVRQCVIKTTESSHGDNVYVVVKIEFKENDCLFTLFNGKKSLLSDILSKKTPLLFENLVKQTSQMASFNESSVNTVRFMTLLYPDNKARLTATWFKIGRSGKCVDNAGSGGNVDGCVDIETGELKYVVQFDGWDNVKDITHHPDSGALLEGVRIDNWKAIVDQVLRFQESLPYVKAAGWDIAITDDGPVVIEVNDFWDRTGQLFIRRGWRNEIRDCYLAWKKTGVKYPLQRQNNPLSKSHLERIEKKEF